MANNDDVIEALNRNTKSNEGLGGRIDTLATAVDKDRLLADRTRMLTFAVIGLTSAMGFGFAWVLYDRGADNRHNAYVQCVNANESRQFNKGMWDYILGHELGDRSEHQAPDELLMSETILPMIHYANRPRDCDHLDRKYDMPEVPDPPGGHVVIRDGRAILIGKE